MIHVVTSRNQHLYARQLDEMFHMRHEFYVLQRGWKNLTVSNGRETDEYDDENAVYLMNLDPFGRILSTFRLNQTMGPDLLADKLPNYQSEPAPRCQEIWELGRWMVAPHARRRHTGEIAEIQRPLIAGLMEFAVDRGILGFTALSDTAFIERISKVWPIRKMGEPHSCDDAQGETQLIMIEAGPHVLAQTRDKTGISDSVLFELKPDLPKAPQEKQLREKPMRDTESLSGRELEQLRTAASHMITELKAQPMANVEASIQAIDEFTRFIRGITGPEFEDA